MGGLEGLKQGGVFRGFIMSMRREEAMTQVRQCLVAMGSPFVDLSTLCRTGTPIAGSYQPFQVPSALSNQAWLHFRARPHHNISNTVHEDPPKLSLIVELYCVDVCLKQNSAGLSSSLSLSKTILSYPLARLLVSFFLVDDIEQVNVHPPSDFISETETGK